jgi:single stranded DNA-binding protein
MPLPQVTIFGTINNIELKYSQSGMAICSFTIECSEKNAKGEWENLQLRGSCFEKSAEFVNQWFQNGALCVATGKLVTEMYEKDGKKNYTTKLKFPKIEFPPKAKESKEGDQQEQKPYTPPQAEYTKHTDYKPAPRQEMPANTLPSIDIDSEEIPF